MKKVVFILVALMAVAFTSCKETIVSPCEYVYMDFDRESPKTNVSYSDEPCDSIIADIKSALLDSLAGLANPYQEYIESPNYDITNLLDEFGIDKEQYKKLQDTYGVEHVKLEVRIADNFEKLVSGGWYGYTTKKVKCADVWIWYGEYRDDFFWSDHKILHQYYEWNEFEMKWEETSK